MKELSLKSLLTFRNFIIVCCFTSAVSAVLGGAIVYAVIVIYSVFHVLFITRGDKRNNPLCIFIYVVAALSVVANYFEIEPIFRVEERIVMLLLVMLAYAPMINNRQIFIFRKQVFIFFSIGLLFMAIASAVLALKGYGYTGIYLIGLSNWPNSLGYAFGISIIVLLSCLKFVNKYIKIIFVLIIILCIYMIPKTVLRTALYSVPILLFLYTYFNTVSIKTWLRSLVSVIIIVFCFLSLIKLDMSIINMKNEIAVESGMSSRDKIFEARIKEFYESPILGVGTFRCLMKYQRVNSNGNVEGGNSFLMFLSMNGIIGFVVLVVFYVTSLFSFIKYVYIKRKRGLSTFEQFLCLVLVFNFIYMQQAGALLNPGFYITGFNWLSLSMAYMYPQYNKYIVYDRTKKNTTNTVY